MNTDFYGIEPTGDFIDETKRISGFCLLEKIQPAFNRMVQWEAGEMLQKDESVRYNYLVDRQLMHHFGATFNDWTKLHYNDEYARKVGFERTPVQGALISCLIVKSIACTFGEASILRMHNLEFLKPVYPGSEISVELHVLNNIKDMLLTIQTRICIGKTVHYQGVTKIRAFENM